MAFIAAKCPSCGGDLQVPDDRDIVKCMYCGIDVIVREAVKLISGDSKNFMALAQTAEESGNHAEAYGYFTKVLEIEPNNFLAWQGKGKSAGWQSNLNNSRLKEMLTCFNKAIESANNDAMKEVLRTQCALEMLLVAKSYFELSTEHTIKFISVPEAKYEHFDRCKEVVAVCDQAKSMDPDLAQASALAVDVSTRQLRVSGISEADKSYFTSAITRNGGATNTASSSNNISGGSACFVITATMGNENHATVKSLREFRDEILMNFRLGRKFIDWYYQKGPLIADKIKKSQGLRLLSFVFIVMPCYTAGVMIVASKRFIFGSSK